MLGITIRHRYPEFVLDVAFESPADRTTVLFGPSGCGKSTIAKAVAGLLRPDSGRICMGGTVLYDATHRVWTAPERRAIGFVFQDSHLFPHMSVRSNLCYGLRRARGRRIGIELASIVALLGLERLLTRAPGSLSGGERQRVAIGRALLSQPRLLVMDEPLASLDQARKSEILPYLGRLKAEVGMPILYITHSIDEVARLADRVVMLENGRVTATGDFDAILARSDLSFAHREDAAAVLTVRVEAHDTARQLTKLQADCGELWVPLITMPLDSMMRVRIPAREVILATSRPQAVSLHNVIACRVKASTIVGSMALVELQAGPSAVLLARVTADAIDRLRITPGAAILALVKAMSIDVLTRGPQDLD